MSKHENALAAKLGGAKISDEELEKRLAAADQKIAGASLGFSDWAAADIAEALQAVAKLASGGDSEAVTGVVFKIAHDLKGQGSTFGFPLVTQIGGQLCDVVRSVEPSSDEKFVGVVKAHLAAMNLILQQNIKGNGDEATQQLVEKLALAAKSLARK